MSRAHARLLLVLLLAATASVLFLAPGRGYWVIDPDAAAYVGLAQALARGDGFEFQGVPHAKFPPGFPAWLALAIKIAGDPTQWSALRDAVAVAGVACVGLTYLAGRRLLRAPRGLALVLATATASSVFFVQYAVAFLRSEPLFTALFLASLVCGEDFRRRGGARRAAACGLFAGLATLTRTAGITVLPALLVARFLAGRKRVAMRTLVVELTICVAFAVAPPGAFAWRNATLDGPKSSGYGAELTAAYALDLTKDVDETMPRIDAAGMVARGRQNLAVFAESVGKYLANSPKGGQLAVSTHADGPHLHLGGVVLLFILAFGCERWIRRGASLPALALVGYVALYLIWPFNQQQRFYMPVQTLILGAFAVGIAPVVTRGLALLEHRGARVAAAVALLAAAGVLAQKRSVDPTVLGRWSAEYALFVFGVVAAGLATLVLAATGWRIAALGERLLRWIPRGFAVISAALLALFIRGSLIPEHQRFLEDRAAHPVPPEYATIKTHPKLIELVDWLKRNTKPGELVMSDIPKMIHMMTGLRTTPLRVSSAEQHIVLDTPDGRPTYVYYSYEIGQIDQIVDAWAPRHLETVLTIEASEGHATNQIRLYRVPADAK